jgi:AcrR family transcriptional regulator
VPSRRRLRPEDRRLELLDVAAAEFATHPYDDVVMDEVAARAGVSRALLYRYFPSKRELFAAMYQQAADRLLAATTFDATQPLFPQVTAGLEEHLDYFVANRNTVLAANRVLAGDPAVQAIISEELGVIRDRLLELRLLDEPTRLLLSTVLMSWLTFVRTMCVEWLTHQAFSRAELRDICLGALQGAFDEAPILDLSHYLSGPTPAVKEWPRPRRTRHPSDRGPGPSRRVP